MKARRLGTKEHGVLGCFLSHLRALREALDGGFDLIMEDSCRIRCDRVGATCLRRAVAWQRANAADLLYYGWLGHKDNLERVHAVCASGSEPTVHLPRGVTKGKEHDLIFCTHAYIGSKRMYEQLCRDLLTQPGKLFRKERRGQTVVSPIDKFLLWRAAAGGLQVRTCKEPCCFRAPLMRSCIHPQYDERMTETSGFQLDLFGLDWTMVWLTSEEKDAPSALQKRWELATLEGKQHWWRKRQQKWEAWRLRKEAQGLWIEQAKDGETPMDRLVVQCDNKDGQEHQQES